MKKQMKNLYQKIALIATICLPFAVFGQQFTVDHLEIRELPNSTKASLLKSLPEEAFEITALDFNKDINGQQHSRYQITLNGIPLKGLHLTHHELTTANRVVIPTRIPAVEAIQNQQSRFSPDQVRALARQHVPAEVYGHLGEREVHPEEVRLVYVPNNYDWDEKEWFLAYEVDVFSKKPLQSKRVTIDAQNGDLIFIENRLCSIHGHEATNAVDEGTAVTKYHGTQTIQTTLIDDNYVLWDQTRGEGIRTVNLNVPDGVNETEVDFLDADNFWDNFNEDQDEVAGDVHWGSAATWDYLLETFNRLGIDGEGGELRSRVHLDDSNAFWNGNVTIYGDGGSGNFDNPFTYIDIIAHEMTHGLTQHTSGLIYTRESGGLNEAFSDIMGVSTENYTFPDSVDWRLGEQLSSNGNIIRNMANPAALGMPDTYGGNNWDEVLGVHTGSSMANLWYHFLVEGGTGENDFGYTFDFPGIGWEEAQQIAFHTWTNYLRPNSNYAQCADFSIISASDLYGKCSPQVQAVKEGWRAVGVLPPMDDVAISANKRKICELGDSVTFRLNTPVEEIMWEFGDGNSSSTLNPTHIYTSNGNYEFSATGMTCDGEPFAVTGEFEINVDETLEDCNVITLRPDEEQEVAFCTGSFIDDGGLNGNYSNGYFSDLLVEAEGALGYNVEIVSFQTRNNEDILSIRTDRGTGLRTRESFSGSFVEPQVIFFECSRINFTFQSSNAFDDEGFEIRWECLDENSLTLPTLDPAFTVADCGYDIDFESNATLTSDIRWDFGDGNTGSGRNPSHLYSAQGTYTVTCIANNPMGSVSESIEVEVVFDEIGIKGPHQLLPNVIGNYEAILPEGATLISGIWRVDGDLVAVGSNPEIAIEELGFHEIVLAGQYLNLCRDRDTFIVEVVDELSSLQNFSAGELTILPNPTKDYFLVTNADLLQGEWSIHLINGLGQKVEQYQNNFDGNEDSSYRLPDLPAGVYYLQFENPSSERFLKKLMILE